MITPCLLPYINHKYTWSCSTNGYGNGWFVEKECVRCEFMRTPPIRVIGHVIAITGQRVPESGSGPFRLAKIDYRRVHDWGWP